MRRSKSLGLWFERPIVALALSGLLLACSSTPPVDLSLNTQTGAVVGTVTGGINGVTGGDTALTTGGALITTTGGAVIATTGGSGSTGGDMAGSDAAVGTGGTTAANGLPKCEATSTDPCGIFITNTGDEIELGPYGSVMDTNVGTGFENAINSADMPSDTTTCAIFASSFGAPQADTDALLDTMDLDFALYTVFRPAVIADGETFPVITWGNGTCALPGGYGALLRYVASHGYVVVAANSRWVDQGNNEMNHALDFMFAANDDATSAYYHLIDTTKVGAMGHSQGSSATATASSDSRIHSVILFNGGTSASKPFWALSGDRDIGNPTADSYKTDINAATEAAYLFFHNVPMYGTGSIINLDGHLTLMTQPERVIEPTVAWWDYMLKDDQAARDWFVGTSCTLCATSSDYEYGQHGLH